MTSDESGDEILRIPAIDCYATVESHGVSVHMDGDRDAEVWIEGPEEAGEVHDVPVYRVRIDASQNGVQSDIAFFVPVNELKRAIQDGDDGD